MMEREKRTTTADIASGGESEVRESEVRAGERELDEELHEGVRDGTEPEERRPLLGDDATSDVGSRWERIQGSFVDEPRRAVEEADALVAELMQQLADSFAKASNAIGRSSIVFSQPDGPSGAGLVLRAGPSRCSATTSGPQHNAEVLPNP